MKKFKRIKQEDKRSSSFKRLLPSVSVLGIYPSVYSTIPQMLILLFLLIALVSEAAKHFTNGKELTK
ncbi:hypothetical protein BSR82_06550 [Bacillus subtilis]|nr:hypothetical protein BSR82_06550 [Bacillus subtilis]PAE60471.1 hypothetical protein CHH88_07420 [Bacillus subtilis]